ncbi:MAG TPA: anthranilate synthase component I, partial [Flavobacteriales bacterium]|nr:anthranilate synthase component I [Flavobacteriales bacterium]
MQNRFNKGSHMHNHRSQTHVDQYETQGGLHIQRHIETLPNNDALHTLVEQLDAHQGVLLSSGFEYPGRYTRWDIGFVDPPIMLTSHQRNFTIKALNDRGKVLLSFIEVILKSSTYIEAIDIRPQTIEGSLIKASPPESEELRSRSISIFSLLRSLKSFFHSDFDPYLGFYGAFGYDLAFEFDPVEKKIPRSE